MITQNNLEEYLRFFDGTACFIKSENGIMIAEQLEISVDLENKKIIYPKKININGEQTINFKANENFVVLDCIIRLLRQGYKPEHITLEPKFKVGHGTSGGRADIQVKDNNGKSVIIIECKTPGKEFNKEWNEMHEDGGQLFSYLQQESDTEFLSLYTADFIDNISTTPDYYLIKVQDDKSITREKNKKYYSDAKKVKDLFEVWKNTYQFDYQTCGFLEEDIEPYKIGKSTYSINNLQEVDSTTIKKKYHQYATILRKYNVSGKENAFDKLVNLFLAKLIDEIQNAENPKGLKFYWKGASYDTQYALQDRLQKLYKDGMEKFLKEDVTYIDNNQINSAFKLFKKDPDATKNKILDYFHKLKFYTNNDFSFIDVHNKKLFEQNAVILLETIRMFQDMKLKTTDQNQFLGDLFEGFLNKGIKQSEGQFFTPQPIVKFIISSLPLKEMVANNSEPLQTIDYACGAGHFLTEYAYQIKDFVPEPKKYYEAIIGIEKEYRLSKVSKVSAFMYGQDGIRIVYGDGLHHSDEVKNDTFDLLIANPPYAVDGFLETLSEEDRNEYTLFSAVGNIETNDAIETFFVERTKQLLKEDGIAALVLPQTIITKDGIYSETQKIILEYFNIVAICEMNKGTFWKTNTTTSILFLRKKSTNPPLAEHYKNRVDGWFAGNFDKDVIFDDLQFVQDYCQLRKINFTDYKNLMNNNDETIKKIEKEKLYYYLLARNNPSKILIMQTPNDTKIGKQFLGYFWRDRKGQEGLHYNNEKANLENGIDWKGINQIKTPLFDPLNLFDNPNKINSLIRDNFNNKPVTIPIELSEYVKQLDLVDILDFNKDKFNPSFNINADVKIDIKSKFGLKNLGGKGGFIIENPKSTIQVNSAENNISGKYPFFTSGEEVYKYDKKLVSGKNLYMATGGIANIKFYDGDAAYSTDTYSFKTTDDILPQVLYEILQSVINEINILYFKGQGLKHLQKNDFKSLQIPVPDIETQRNMVKEFKKIDKDIEEKKLLIEQNNETIKSLIQQALSNKPLTNYKLNDKYNFTLFIGKRVEAYQTDKLAAYPVYSANVNKLFGEGYTDKNPAEDITEVKNNGFTTDSILWGIDGDWMTGYQIKDIDFYPTDHCGVLRVKTNAINPYFMKFAFDLLGQKNRFDRTNRAKLDVVSNLSVDLPNIKIQNNVIQQVKQIELQNEKSQLSIIETAKLKKVVIDKYLN